MILAAICLSVLSIVELQGRWRICQGERIVFPSNEDENVNLNSVQVSQRVPESLLIRMKDIQHASEFLSRFVVDYETPVVDVSGISGRRGMASPPAFSIAEFAVCRPELQVVELERPESGDIMLWPQCVRVPRCGGCCTSNRLACRPVTFSNVNVTVLQVRYSPQSGQSFESDGLRTIPVEQHDHCMCECRIREEDCRTDIQVYKPDECVCVCANQELASNCTGPRKIWDPEHCACKCRKIQLCSTGRHFNLNTCMCELPRRSRSNRDSRQNATARNSTDCSHA